MVESLRRLGLMARESTPEFRHVAQLARQLLAVPMAFVVLASGDRRPPTSAELMSEPGIAFSAVSPITSRDGTTIGTLCVVSHETRGFSVADEAALRELAGIVGQEIAAVQHAAEDELTGLHNEKGFLLVGEHALRLCRRNRTPALALSVTMRGLDDVAESHGRDARDDLVRAAADVMTAAFRSADVIGRVGEYEFGALLVDYAVEPSVALVHLDTATAERNAEGGIAADLSFSVGTALFDPKWPLSLAELIVEAGAARQDR